ncbi:MAG: 4Fe-4S binding protein [Deltaproteobacteria bacterium]|nr:4Fe-4S binding protein [Deltaproteobacteria bacterium]
MCQECLEHSIAKIFGQDQPSWFFSPHAYDYESFAASIEKQGEYGSQYEFINAINPGKFGAEWVKKVVEGGRTCQVVTWEEALEVLRICKEANPEGSNFFGLLDTCICKRTRGGDITEPVCMFMLHMPKPEDMPPPREIDRPRNKEEAPLRQTYDPGDLPKMKEMLLDFERRLGLVHSLFTIHFPHVITVCNCEMPYCHSLRQRYLYGVREAAIEGYYVISVNNDKCVGCGDCEAQCQFGVINLDKRLGKIATMPTLCMGCGICRSVCPTGAIEMVPRKRVTQLETPEPANLQAVIEQEAGKK